MRENQDINSSAAADSAAVSGTFAEEVPAASPAAPCGSFVLVLNGGAKAKDISCTYDPEKGDIRRLKSGSLEYRFHDGFPDNGSVSVSNAFVYPEHRFVGWRMRVKASGKWRWYLPDGTFSEGGELSAPVPKGVITQNACLPVLSAGAAENAGFAGTPEEAAENDGNAGTPEEAAENDGNAGTPKKAAEGAGCADAASGAAKEHAGRTAASAQAEEAATVVLEAVWEDQKFHILLLTNRDSDNLGDLVIEGCDISLIRTIMKNLGIPEKSYEIQSRAAGIVSKKYVETKEPQLLFPAKEAVKNTDLVFFGGAPLFNYSYQIFYERTAVTLELAQKYDKPAVFSAIGVEKYDEEDARCQRLKETLNFDCVKSITTRDDFASLQAYVENPDIRIGKVADPAVFAKEVFEDFVLPPKPAAAKKKIGLFVLRAGGFKNNGIAFSPNKAAELWINLLHGLEESGYDCTLLTSGHFGDEAFLDYLIREYGVSQDQCIFNMDAPEKLIAQISQFDAVISCRLHPSIISYSLGVPALGIVWNAKVSQFYESIGCADRAIEVADAVPENMIGRIGEIIDAPADRSEAFRMSVYTSMFDAFRRILEEKGIVSPGTEPYSYDALLKNIVRRGKYSDAARAGYMRGKVRRTYEKYNARAKKKTKGFTLVYHSGTKNPQVQANFDPDSGELSVLSTGSTEFRLKEELYNNGKYLPLGEFVYPGHELAGWRIRVKNADRWYWYMDDHTLCRDKWAPERALKFVLPAGRKLPKMPQNGFDVMVIEAVWEPGSRKQAIKKWRKMHKKSAKARQRGRNR